MSDDHQQYLPPSFIALYTDRRQRLRLILNELRQRAELCEDLAQQLTDTARAHHFDLGLSEDMVLSRCHDGLCSEGSGLNPLEAWWITQRLAELLDWPQPDTPQPAIDDLHT